MIPREICALAFARGNSISNSVSRSTPRLPALLLTFFLYREDMYAQDSIDLLSKSGIDFKEHEAKG